MNISKLQWLLRIKTHLNIVTEFNYVGSSRNSTNGSSKTISWKHFGMNQRLIYQSPNDFVIVSLSGWKGLDLKASHLNNLTLEVICALWLWLYEVCFGIWSSGCIDLCRVRCALIFQLCQSGQMACVLLFSAVLKAGARVYQHTQAQTQLKYSNTFSFFRARFLFSFISLMCCVFGIGKDQNNFFVLFLFGQQKGTIYIIAIIICN